MTCSRSFREGMANPGPEPSSLLQDSPGASGGWLGAFSSAGCLREAALRPGEGPPGGGGSVFAGSGRSHRFCLRTCPAGLSSAGEEVKIARPSGQPPGCGQQGMPFP